MRFSGEIGHYSMLARAADAQCGRSEPPKHRHSVRRRYGLWRLGRSERRLENSHAESRSTGPGRNAITDAHRSSGVCTPSRYALITGRYHWRKFHDIVPSFGPPALEAADRDYQPAIPASPVVRFEYHS